MQPAEEGILQLETGLEALQASPTFQGPVEPVDKQQSYDHLALIYETQAEQFATAIPFIKHGLERGERCIYIADENGTEEVLEALRDAGVDVDAALESDALVMHTAQDSYLRHGTFEPDDMIAFLSETIEEAASAYEGLRITGEMTWVFGDEPPLEALIEYENQLNQLLPSANGIALCQYNREQFSVETLRDIIKTHPHLIYDDTVCQNFYYTPPEEFFGPDQPEREIDRMMETLVDRTEARVELQRREYFLQRCYAITSDPSLSFDEKLERLLEFGREQFDLEIGCLTHLPAWDDEFRMQKAVGPEGTPPEGILPVQPGDGCFCRQAIGKEEPVDVADVRGTEWAEDPIHQQHGLTSYFGTKITVGPKPYGTLWFGSPSSREETFTDTEHMFLDLMGQWVSYELERKENRRYQRTLCEIASDPNRLFDEKLQEIFDLGCERFDLELGGLARIDPARDLIEVEATSGDHDYLALGTQVPLSETYCRRTIDGETITVVDPIGCGFENALVYEEFGIETHLGTRIALENEPDRVFFFVSSESREQAFSDAERTFHDLMSQWVRYELEQRQRQRSLEESNERLEQFAYAASHDLQEPLRMVSSYLQLLENRYGDAFDEDGEEFLEFAVDGADRMREMIDGLLEYSRIETRGDPFEPMALETLLEDVLEDLQIQIEESNAEITVEQLPRIEGDASQLRQVFQNLIENAITYCGDNPPRITVAAKRRGGKCVVSVRDEGIGIDPDDQDRIFTVFDRLHSREEYDGTGIGLALCQRIIERHEGEIWVESEPGDGSTFSFTLPMARD